KRVFGYGSNTTSTVAWRSRGALGIRFVIDREECFSHKVEMGETVHFSFVVIKSEGSWHYSEEGVDLVYDAAEHFKPLFEHIGKLEEALYNIQFEQHWLEAQTDRQAIGINKAFAYFSYDSPSFQQIRITVFLVETIVFSFWHMFSIR
ncbi:PREDICTED: transmembrane emp24 domain-containing protein p24beta2-like, partial [Nicotiana attenuata]|uniref:transmembrane emp24 domain-containing protein p24beta2-like n=1 Tax=Nicotiana attenuata TaxID=49451 RepID=UPI0009052214